VPRSRSDLHPLLAAGALTLVALGLRVLAARQSLAGDELFSYEVVVRPTLGDVLDGVRGPLEITPPGWFVVAWAFAKIGDPTVWLKAPSVLAGTLTVPVAYALGVRTVGRPAGLIGGALLAIGPYAIFYGSEARAYALTGLLVALSTLLLLVALERGGWAWWVAFGATVAAAMYAHYVAAFPLAAQLAWALWAHHSRWVPVLVAYAGAAVAYIPWIPGLLDDRHSPYQDAIGRVWPFNARYVGTALLQWVDGDPNWRVVKVPGPLALGLLAVAGALLVAGLTVAYRAGSAASRARAAPGQTSAANPVRPAASNPEPRLLGLPARTVLVITLAASAPVLAIVWSVFAPSVFVPRTLVGSLPAFALLVGAAITAVPRGLGIAAAACLVLALALGTARTFGDFIRPPFRPAASYLNDHARPGEPVLEMGTFDPGQLEPHLDPARPVYRAGCANPSTGPGQILTGRVHCGPGANGVRPALAAGRRAGRLWLVSWGARPRSLPGFRAVGVHRWDGGLGVWVAEERPVRR
jgi:Dolichyl-phosphate-mannose-protein mannosyltransferase